MRTFVGIDIAKADFVVTSRPEGETWTATNNPAGIHTTCARLQAMAPALIVLEATGGYETALVAALAAAALPVVVVNPRQVRDFAKATGQLAKTDRLDAALLALFAERVPPTPRPWSDEAHGQLEALITRRRPLLDMLTAERQRLEQAAATIRQDLVRHIRWLERRVAAVDRDLDDTIQQSPVWR
ncbi:MAG: transposase, partial [Acidobacteriota bacterium]|nr:transposase [Acidobacteriota bacterium]